MKISSPLFSFFFDKAYSRADCAILLSDLNPHDGRNLLARSEIIVPYGIEDMALQTISRPATQSPRILFVGVIRESKGVVVLLEACGKLAEKQHGFSLEIMGKFESGEFEDRVHLMVKALKIESNISFLGVLSGNPKLEAFRRADIFCFPTFFKSETFGVVLLEAMQYSLPIVATAWRGIPSIVEDNVNGFLVKPNDSAELFDRLEKLVVDKTLRARMGEKGREVFLARYTLRMFHNQLERVFQSC